MLFYKAAAESNTYRSSANSLTLANTFRDGLNDRSNGTAIARSGKAASIEKFKMDFILEKDSSW